MQVVHRSRVVLVARVWLYGENDRVRRDEPGDVVDVAVRVVANASLAEPDRAVDTQPLLEYLLVVVARHARVPHLYVAQQPLFGHEEQTIAVYIDAAPFEDDALAIVLPARFLPAQPRQRRDCCSDSIVESPVVVLRPRVELPVEQDDVSRFVSNGDWCRVAKPDSIGWYDVEADRESG